MGRFEAAKDVVDEVHQTARRASQKVQQQAQAAGRKALDAAESLKDDAARRLHRGRGRKHESEAEESDDDTPESHGHLRNKAAEAQEKMSEKARGATSKLRDAKNKARRVATEGKDELVRVARKPYHHAPEIVGYLGITCIAFMIVAVLMRTGGDPTGSVAGTYPAGMEHHFPHIGHDKPMGAFEQMARKIFHKPPHPPSAFDKAQDAAVGVFDAAFDAASSVLEKSADVAEHVARKAGEKTIELAGDAVHAAGHGVKEAGHLAAEAAAKIGKHAL